MNPDKEIIDEMSKELELNKVGQINLKYYMHLLRLLLEWEKELITLLASVET